MINLDKDTVRLQAMARQLDALSLRYERVEAIYGIAMPAWLRPYFLNDLGQIASELTPGEVGCYASHLLAMERIAQTDRIAVVMEDDLRLGDDLPDILTAASRLPRDFDIIKLCSHPTKRQSFHVRALNQTYGLVKYKRVPFGAGAYLITPAGARKFMNWKIARGAPIDYEFRRVWESGLVIWELDPAPVVQNVAPSVIDEFGLRPTQIKYYSAPGIAQRLARLAHDVSWTGHASLRKVTAALQL